VLDKLGKDPALASNIFMTMVTDLVGFGASWHRHRAALRATTPGKQRRARSYEGGAPTVVTGAVVCAGEPSSAWRRMRMLMTITAASPPG